uniref:adenylate kinase 7-like n=1 Tax=Myxine glutinosa TaxID=7769 RepID=UPI00358DDA8F
MYQIVGSLINYDSDVPEFAEDIIMSQNKQVLVNYLMDCDVIIYNVSDDENYAMVSEAGMVLKGFYEKLNLISSRKTFIVISSIMTWINIKSAKSVSHPQMHLGERHRHNRRPHAKYCKHLDLENFIMASIKLGRKKLSCYVVVPGLFYGAGENVFYSLFKAAWLGEDLPLLEDGTNIIPTIHIKDLVSIISNTIELKPPVRYILAVDNGNNSLGQITQKISTMLGTGQIRMVSKTEALENNIFQAELMQNLLLNLRMDSTVVTNMSFNWCSEGGLVKNITKVINEFRECRGVKPVKLCILGPPGVGKSTLAEKICSIYTINHLKIEDVICDGISKLEQQVNIVEKPAEDVDKDKLMAMTMLNEIKKNKAINEGHLDDCHVIDFYRGKLLSSPCQNQGFVLDGFPKSAAQATELFAGKASLKGLPHNTKYNSNIMPELVINLEAPDTFLTERFRNLSEVKLDAGNLAEESFTRRLTDFRACNVAEETIVDYFNELEVYVRGFDAANEAGWTSMLRKILKLLGKPHTYDVSDKEKAAAQQLEEEEKRAEEEALQKERERKEAEQKKLEEEKLEWMHSLQFARSEAEELMQARRLPLRHYLMQYVIPPIIEGLVECSKIKADDPVDYLAEYLLRRYQDED